MASSDFKYEAFSKELIKKGLLSEEMDDYSKMFLSRCDKIRENRPAKMNQLNELTMVSGCLSMELTCNKQVADDLLQEQTEEISGFQDILNEINAAEEERNTLIWKFGEAVNSFENKLRSLGDDFNLDNLKDKVADLTDEKAMHERIEHTMKSIQNDAKRLEKAVGEIPQFDNLKVIRNKQLVTDAELEDKEKQLTIFKRALKQMEAKLQCE